MEVLQLPVGSLDMQYICMPLRQASIIFIQYLLVALQYEEASSYSILIKCNFCTFTLCLYPALDAQGRRLCTLLHGVPYCN